MAIYRILQNSAFDPEDIALLTTAYETTLETLRLVNRADPVTELIARKIIELAQTGVRDSAQLCAMAIKDLGIATEDQ